jgi:hypothetical protein
MDGKRMSGEMNTSVGNGLMNMLCTFFLLEQAGNSEYGGYFEGDDGVCWYTNPTFSSSKPPSQFDYRDLGAKIKIEIPDEPTLASFCGLIFDPEVCDNVTEPMAVLMNHGWTSHQYVAAGRTKLDALLKSKSLSLLYSYPGAPITRSLALYGLRVTGHIDDKYMNKVLEKKYMNTYEREKLQYQQSASQEKFEQLLNHKVNFKTRLLVERKFGISVELQLHIENYLDNLTTLQPLNIPLALDHVDKDCIDYYERYGYNTNKPYDHFFQLPNIRKYKIFKNHIDYFEQ